MPQYDKSDLPPSTLRANGKEWTREEFDADSYQWARILSEDEYDWELSDVSLVGTDQPVRVVMLQHLDGEWKVTASETAGPDSQRPGFVELISSEFDASSTDFTESIELVHDFVKKLS